MKSVTKSSYTQAPPDWLVDALKKLNEQYPDDSFEAVMKYSAVDPETEAPLVIPAGEQPPDNVKYMHLPRIRCRDCPGKLYQPGPEFTSANFEVHLKNRQHREKVGIRVTKQAAAGSGAGTARSSTS